MSSVFILALEDLLGTFFTVLQLFSIGMKDTFLICFNLSS